MARRAWTPPFPLTEYFDILFYLYQLYNIEARVYAITSTPTSPRKYLKSVGKKNLVLLLGNAK